MAAKTVPLSRRYRNRAEECRRIAEWRRNAGQVVADRGGLRLDGNAGCRIGRIGTVLCQVEDQAHLIGSRGRI